MDAKYLFLIATGFQTASFIAMFTAVTLSTGLIG